MLGTDCLAYTFEATRITQNRYINQTMLDFQKNNNYCIISSCIIYGSCIWYLSKKINIYLLFRMKRPSSATYALLIRV